MIDWKRFEDEVPVEPKTVLLLAEDAAANREWSTETFDVVVKRNGEWLWSRTSCEDHLGDVLTEEVYPEMYLSKQRCSWMGLVATTGHTHWAYVDPPEDA